MKYKESKAHKVGDNISTDEIIPSRYLVTTDEKKLGERCLEAIDKNFSKKVKPGDILVAGKNFGCGSSREHAVLAIKGCGIKYVIASSFARIFYRNSINNGLVVIESEEMSQKIDDGNSIKVDFIKGKIYNLTKKEVYKFKPYPKFIKKIINSGSLMNWVKCSKLHKEKQ